MTVRVCDIIDDPEFKRSILEIDYAHDLWLVRFNSERGYPTPKRVWKRLLKTRKELREPI